MPATRSTGSNKKTLKKQQVKAHDDDAKVRALPLLLPPPPTTNALVHTLPAVRYTRDTHVSNMTSLAHFDA